MSRVGAGTTVQLASPLPNSSNIDPVSGIWSAAIRAGSMSASRPGSGSPQREITAPRRSRHSETSRSHQSGTNPSESAGCVP